MTFSGRIALDRGLALQADTRRGAETTEVLLELEGTREPCTLHWGVGRGARRWQPPSSAWPADSRAADGGAVDTPFPDVPPRRLTVTLRPAAGDTSLDFVLFFPASNRWDNNRGHDYHVPVSAGDAGGGHGSNETIEAMSAVIIEREKGNHSWTLMHRFNLCHDLLDRIGPDDGEGLALLFVWLRFSAIRQLDWQRNYNTKPAELAHAQDRLTLKLADFYVRSARSRASRNAAGVGSRETRAATWIRLLLTTVGRGGEGQRVRDEVLNIMHRHHIKEVSGHFMEEWHQKLHNNTTPDDVVICEAYLAFLRSHGDRGVFYRTLENGGVTRARLQSYERPIRSDPDFIPHLKDALMGDFEAFLRVLKRLHSGTDLDAAIEGAGAAAGDDLGDLLHWIQRHRHEGGAPLDVLVSRITDARRMTGTLLDSRHDTSLVRALLYLDLALEELVRLAIERQFHQQLALETMTTLIALVFENVRLSVEDEELEHCRNEWDRVRDASRDDPAWPLRADAALDRAGRAVARLLDSYQRVLQPIAERLGQGFGADQWAIAAFSEEVIRGRPIIVLPVLAKLLRQAVRVSGGLPPWELVSSGRGSGRLRVVDSLATVQGTEIVEPTVVLAASVGGQEEIPSGVTAVVTSQDLDMLSHLAIRARNAGVLMASCHDGAQIQRLRALEGRPLTLTVGPGGEVVVHEGIADGVGATRSAEGGARGARLVASGTFAGYALGQDRFDERTVGRKALGLVYLRGRVPPWIHLPRSVAIPFGAMEQALSDGRNADAARRCAEAAASLGRMPSADRGARRQALEELRRAISSLAMAEAFPGELRTAMDTAGLTCPDAGRAWQAVTQVWASKWNERAFLSREANGIDHVRLLMSVLIQQVVEADYAFVIHTSSPAAGARDDLYAEIVLGLGETLVGSYPGRALSFTRNKAGGRVRLRTLPSKSVGLFGGGLIFRSDSNAEDLADYAGAGLYDSVMLDAPREELLDYAREPLVWDASYQRDFMDRVAHIGLAVEQAAGTAQDVEGARAGGEWYVVQSRPQVGAANA